MPSARLSRTLQVSAAHRLHSSSLTDEENAQTYGPCNRKHGHGHNFKIKVTVFGEVDEKTGMVMNIATLKSIMQSEIENVIDHRHLDLDIPYFATRPSTVENLAMFVWEQLSNGFEQRGLPKELLFEVEIYETEANSVVYRNETR